MRLNIFWPTKLQRPSGGWEKMTPRPPRRKRRRPPAMRDTILRFSAPLEILQAAAGDDPAKPAKFSAMVYGGGLMPIGGWGDVAVDLAGLSLPPSLPVLSAHND